MGEGQSMRVLVLVLVAVLVAGRPSHSGVSKKGPSHHVQHHEQQVHATHKAVEHKTKQPVAHKSSRHITEVFHAGSDLELLKLKVDQSSLSHDDKQMYTANILEMEELMSKIAQPLTSAEKHNAVTQLRERMDLVRHLSTLLKHTDKSAVPDAMLKTATALVTQMKNKYSGRLSSSDQENLDALGLDLEMLNISQDPEETKDLAMAIRWRIPSLQSLERRLEKSTDEPVKAAAPVESEHNDDENNKVESDNNADNVASETNGELEEATPASAEFDNENGKEANEKESDANPELEEADNQHNDDNEAAVPVTSSEENEDDQQEAKPELEESKTEQKDENDEDKAEDNENANEKTPEAKSEEKKDTSAETKGSENVDSLASMSLNKIHQLEETLSTSKLPEDKRERVLTNLKGLERDAIALQDDSLSPDQRADLESAMKLRVSMLRDMERFV